MKEIDFEILDDRGITSTLKCDCNTVFDVDAHTELNLIWNKEQKAMVAICPNCKNIQK